MLSVVRFNNTRTYVVHGERSETCRWRGLWVAVRIAPTEMKYQYGRAGIRAGYQLLYEPGLQRDRRRARKPRRNFLLAGGIPTVLTTLVRVRVSTGTRTQQADPPRACVSRVQPQPLSITTFSTACRLGREGRLGVRLHRSGSTSDQNE